MTPQERAVIDAAKAWVKGNTNFESQKLIQAVCVLDPPSLPDRLRKHAKENPGCCGDPDLYREAADKIESYKVIQDTEREYCARVATDIARNGNYDSATCNLLALVAERIRAR